VSYGTASVPRSGGLQKSLQSCCHWPDGMGLSRLAPHSPYLGWAFWRRLQLMSSAQSGTFIEGFLMTPRPHVFGAADRCRCENGTVEVPKTDLGLGYEPDTRVVMEAYRVS